MIATLPAAMVLSAFALLLQPSGPPRRRLSPRVDTTGSRADAARRWAIRCFGIRSLPVVTAGPLIAMGVPVVGWVHAISLGAAGGLICRVLLRRRRETPPDPLATAAGCELLSVCLRAGLPVPVALLAAAEEFGAPAARVLREVERALRFGTDPGSAWAPALEQPDTAELARAARRTARTGGGLARIADDLAARQRAESNAQARSRAQRVSVWVAAPLGLCFLPAFFCLGILPVVIGMVEQMAVHW